MSNSDPVPPELDLDQLILLFVAKRLGSQIDQEIIREIPSLPVVEIVREFRKEEGPTPIDIRASLLDLIDRGWIAERVYGHETPSFDLMEEGTVILLRTAGLLAARFLEEGVGRSTVVLTVQLKAIKDGKALSARLETGVDALDKKLDQSGVALQAFYLLVAFAPEPNRRLWIGDPRVTSAMDFLGTHGVHAKRGKGIRLGSSPDKLAEALEVYRKIFPNLMKGKGRGDERRREWWFEGGFPEVDFTAHPNALVQTWSDLRHAVWSVAIRNRNPFLAREP